MVGNFCLVLCFSFFRLQEIEELYEAKCREGEVWNGIFYFSSDNFILLILLRVLDRKNKLLTVSAFCFLNSIAPFNELEPKKTSSYTIPDSSYCNRFDLVYTILDSCTPVPSLGILWPLLIVIIFSVCVS